MVELDLDENAESMDTLDVPEADNPELESDDDEGG